MVIKRTIDKETVKDLPKPPFRDRYMSYRHRGSGEGSRLSEVLPVAGHRQRNPSIVHKRTDTQGGPAADFLRGTLLSVPPQPDGTDSAGITLLENPSVTKVGLSLRDDFMMLHKRAPFEQHACIELQEYVRAFGIQDKSLQKIYAILFGEKISKSQRLSNWEAETLTEPQKLYAATDAWACLNIYNKLQELKRTGDFEIEANNNVVM